ncbi:MAG: hypothetical protein PUJ59_03085 [Clostridiaceae bacterium]|nr:hypothetical protein [Clostridiaceae bacterium]MDY5888866.1 hypothetical protein [Oscillospiraceae bacterium]
MSDKKNNNSDNGFFSEKITIPWLIVTIFSMISFLAFLISMFFGKYTPIFFAIFILAIASVVLLDGIHKKKENYISGNLNFIMVVLCIICAVIVINM